MKEGISLEVCAKKQQYCRRRSDYCFRCKRKLKCVYVDCLTKNESRLRIFVKNQNEKNNEMEVKRNSNQLPTKKGNSRYDLVTCFIENKWVALLTEKVQKIRSMLAGTARGIPRCHMCVVLGVKRTRKINTTNVHKVIHLLTSLPEPTYSL